MTQNELFKDITRIYNVNTAYTLTFQVTDDCNCNCSYCYEINKGKKYMTKDVAKQAINFFINEFSKKEDAKVVALNFIGGEPLLNIEIMDFICSYFLEKCCDLKKIDWISSCHFAFISNGLNINNLIFENFIKKYEDFLTLTITIDGPEEVHNSCRIDKNGLGTFKKAFSNYQKLRYLYPNCVDSETKATISPQNLNNLNKTIKFFIDNNFQIVHINPIYEHKWTLEEAIIYYKQLKMAADYLLQSDKNIKIDLFKEDNFKPLSNNDNNNFCGGLTGRSLTIDPDGNIFTCIRFTESSQLNKELLCIGDIFNGLYYTKKQKKIKDKMDSVTRLSQSPEECKNCKIAKGCGWCSAYNYQLYGDINKKNTNLCNLHKAASLANAYYWNKYYEKNNIDKHFDINLPKEECLKFISQEELNEISFTRS